MNQSTDPNELSEARIKSLRQDLVQLQQISAQCEAMKSDLMAWMEGMDIVVLEGPSVDYNQIVTHDANLLLHHVFHLIGDRLDYLDILKVLNSLSE